MLHLTDYAMAISWSNATRTNCCNVYDDFVKSWLNVTIHYLLIFFAMLCPPSTKAYICVKRALAIYNTESKKSYKTMYFY